jgi:hypothetical protein
MKQSIDKRLMKYKAKSQEVINKNILDDIQLGKNIIEFDKSDVSAQGFDFRVGDTVYKISITSDYSDNFTIDGEIKSNKIMRFYCKVIKLHFRININTAKVLFNKSNIDVRPVNKKDGCIVRINNEQILINKKKNKEGLPAYQIKYLRSIF